MKLTISQFRRRFPDNNTCLHHLFTLRYEGYDICPGCGEDFSYKRVKDRRAYQCDRCSNQVYPTAGTVFHQSTTPLTFWFYAIYLFTTTRNGVAAKELERQLDVSYKTALRMAHHIKMAMMDTRTDKLCGEVSIDETYLGMLGRNMHNSQKKAIDLGTGSSNKTGVMTFIAKDGRVRTKVLGEETDPAKTLADIVKENVREDSTIVTDAYPPYKKLNKSFKKHIRIDHNKDEYVKDGFSVNQNENYHSNLKRMIKGTHIHVSKRHLPKYVAENTFRYVNRSQPDRMFDLILENVCLQAS